MRRRLIACVYGRCEFCGTAHRLSRYQLSLAVCNGWPFPPVRDMAACDCTYVPGWRPQKRWSEVLNI